MVIVLKRMVRLDRMVKLLRMWIFVSSWLSRMRILLSIFWMWMKSMLGKFLVIVF